jgi:hypothetical protein
VLDGEVEDVAIGAHKELYLLRWPCKLDRSAGEFVDDEELPEWEEWAVLLDLTDPQEAEVQTHLVQTCLAFQVQRFVVGRGALYRTFENGRIERIQENGRTVGLEIHHSRPRILEWPEGGHFPDERSYFEKNFSYATWWQPIFDGPETTEPIVLRVDR